MTMTPQQREALPALIQSAERALTYALTSSLGPHMKPKQHRGVQNEKDAEAIGVLEDLRKELGLKSEASPSASAPAPGSPGSPR